jgi:hypothetical protein
VAKRCITAFCHTSDLFDTKEITLFVSTVKFFLTTIIANNYSSTKILPRRFKFPNRLFDSSLPP